MNDTNELLFKGVIVPLVTPLADPATLDIKHLQGLIDYVISRQVHGIMVLGTTGEASYLSTPMRREIIELACRCAAGRTKMLVGMIHTDVSEAFELAQTAAEEGADGIVLTEPYFPITQDTVLEYAQMFAQQSPLPVCLYNRPNQDIVFEIGTVKKLLSLEKIEAIKDSSGKMNYFKELIQLKHIRPDWSVLMGLEELLSEAIYAGADGGVTGGANLFPRLYVDLYYAAIQHKNDKVQSLQKFVEDVVEHVYQPDYLNGLKYALSCKKLCSEILTDPLRIAVPEQKKRIEDFLETFDESYA